MKKRILAIFFLFSIITLLMSCNLTEENPGNFSTPEKTIEHFIKGIKDNNLEHALEACAIQEVSENYDFVALTNHIKMLNPVWQNAPNEYQMYRDINKFRVGAQIAGQIALFSYSFFTDQGLDGSPVRIEDDSQASNFVKAVDPSKLSNLNIKEIEIPPQLLDEKTKEKFNGSFVQIYKADEATERVVLYELDNKFYLGGFQLLRYKDYWKISSLQSALAGTSPMGTVTEISKEEFEEILNE